MASRKEYEMLFQLNAQLGGSYKSTFSNAQKQLVDMQKEIQALSKCQADISAYHKQQEAVGNTAKKLDILKQQYDNIQKEMRETEGYSSDLENKLLSKQQQIDKTAASLERQTQKLQEMDAALRESGIDTDKLTDESKRLETQIGELKDKQEEAADGASSFGDQAVGAFEAVSNAMAAAGIAAALHEIYEAYVECVKIAAEYEATMSTVEAISGASAEELGALSDKAKELGATTKFTATESAEAMTYMAMAGWDAQQMLDGMDGVLQLAAASGEDLALVSDIVTDSMTAFGLTAADTGHYADVLAAAATNANTNVAIMGETFKYAAPVAGALGYTIEDVSTAIGLMANAGVKGSNAGTALRNVFNGLLEGVTLTGAAFGECEVSAVKADGTMMDFATTIEQLRGYFNQMTEAERVNNAITIAGQRGYSGLLAILNATDEDYAKLTNSINNCSGAAKRMADVRMDNLKGDVTLMNSAWDALRVTIGERFNPELRFLTQLWTEVGTLLNDFVVKHPALVKAIMVFVGVIGAAVAGIAGFVAITKVAIPLLQLFTASIPGVGLVMGVATGIATLAAAITGAVAAANEGVPSMSELTEAARGYNSAMSEINSTYSDSIADTMATVSVAESYIARLKELEQVGDKTDEQEREWHNTLVLLSQAMPELAGMIDLTNDTIEGGTAALEANTEAWKRNAQEKAKQEYLNSVAEQYNGILTEQAQNEIKYTEATIKKQRAVEKYNEAQAHLSELYSAAQAEAAAYTRSFGEARDATYYLTDEYYEWVRANNEAQDEISKCDKTLRNLNQAMEEDAAAVAEAEAAMASAEDAIDAMRGAMGDQTQASSDLAEAQAQVAAIIEETTTTLSGLVEAYNDAYEAALESVSGQYALWDEADDVVVTSADSINKALESQATYWSEYNSNLLSLRDRTSEIEGLSEVIASFADGSNESVNAIAGMASASDDDLRRMVENWKSVQQEQEAASGAIADLKTDFTNTMDELQQELEADIDALDLSEDAAAAAKLTVQGYINGSMDMLPQVRSAYQQLANAAISALGGSAPSSNVRKPGNSVKSYAYASGTKNADTGWALVGEFGPEMVYFGGGEKVFTAAETAAMRDNASADTAQVSMLSPEFMSLMATRGRQEALAPVHADLHGSTGAESRSVEMVFRFEGTPSAETVEQLRQASDEIVERVMDELDERDRDADRRHYR